MQVIHLVKSQQNLIFQVKRQILVNSRSGCITVFMVSYWKNYNILQLENKTHSSTVGCSYSGQDSKPKICFQNA